MPDFFAEQLRRSPVMAILRGQDAERAVRVAEACWAGGAELVEVSLASEGAIDVVGAVCRRASERGRLAGAGTVCTAAQVRAAAEAGAAFAIAPGLDAEAVEAARAMGLPYLPGVATPTETQAALSLGCETLKLFPAAVLGPDWIHALSGPFPSIRFVAVGGITAENAGHFLAAGAIGVGIGSGLEPGELGSLIASVRPA